MTKKSEKTKATRRKFLLAAGATAAATIAMPQVSRAQTITWKYQSTWPTKDRTSSISSLTICYAIP